MRWKLISALFLGLLSSALAQNGTPIKQSGNITPGHVPYFVTSGVIGDGGTAANGALSSLGVTNNGGPGLCVSSAPLTAAARNQLCLAVTTNGGAKISSYAYGTATNSDIVFDINGTLQGFPTVSPLPVVVGNLACFGQTTGQLTDCGSSPATVSLTVGSTLINSGTNGLILYDNAGVLGNSTLSGLFDAACSSTIGQFWVQLTNGWGCTLLGYSNPVWWGADPTATNFSTSAMVSAWTALPNVVWPTGKFKLAAATYTFPNSATGSGNDKISLATLAMRGQGGDSTILYFPTGAGLTFAASSFQHTVQFHGFAITTGTTNAGNAISFTNTYPFFGSYTAQSTIDGVTCRGDDGYGATDYWTKCVYLFNVSNVNFDNDNFYGPVASAGGASFGIGVDIEGSLSPGGGSCTTGVGCATSYNFTRTNLVFQGIGLQLGTQAQALFFGGGSAILNGYTGINVPASGAQIRQITVDGAQISVNDNSIIFNTAVSGTQISNSYIGVAPGKNGIVLVSNAGAASGSGTTIIGNNFVATGAGASDGIYIGSNYSPITVIGNTFNGMATGVELASTSGGVVVGPNDYGTVTTTVIDSGTSNTVSSLVPYAAQGDLLYGTGLVADDLARLAKSTSAHQWLSNTGTSNNPAWAQPSCADLSNAGSGCTGSAGISALTGDVTASGTGSVAATLATVNSNVGTFGSATSCVTVTNNAKGLTTAISATTCTPAASSLTGSTLAAGVTASSLTSVGSLTSLIVTGTATVNGQLITNTGTPTIASGACGTGTNGVITSGDNQAGLVTIGAVATTACTISFSTTLSVAPKACVISPANATAAAAGTTLARVSSISTSGWVISGSILGSTAYYYHCY